MVKKIKKIFSLELKEKLICMSRSETHEISIPEGDNPLVAITTKTGN